MLVCMNMKRKTKSAQSLSSLALPALLCTALWGSAAPMIKMGYGLMHIEGTPSVILFAGIRFFLAGLLVLLLQLPRKGKEMLPSAKAWKYIAILGLFQTFGQYFFYYMGLTQVSGTMGSVISGTSALFSLLLAAWVYHLEKMTPAKGIGVLLGLAGIVVMNLDGFSLQFRMEGEGMILLSQLCSAQSAVFISMFGKKQDPVMLSAWQFMAGGAALALLGLGMGGHIQWNLAGVGCLLWLALVSGIAYTLWGVLLAKFPVSAVGIFSCTIPMFGVLFSSLILHESQAFSLQTLCALALITAGVLLINLAGNRKAGSGGADSFSDQTEKSEPDFAENCPSASL